MEKNARIYFVNIFILSTLKVRALKKGKRTEILKNGSNNKEEMKLISGKAKAHRDRKKETEKRRQEGKTSRKKVFS